MGWGESLVTVLYFKAKLPVKDHRVDTLLSLSNALRFPNIIICHCLVVRAPCRMSIF